MSLDDYRVACKINELIHQTPANPFYALILAAMKNADAINLTKLKACFPDTYLELYQRDHSPGGFLRNEGKK